MIRVGILTSSDLGAKGQRKDTSGGAIKELVLSIGAQVTEYAILPDDRGQLAAALKDWADNDKVDLILTTGGTGLGPRDVTPEATLSVIEREVPGLAEAMRQASLRKTPLAMISRQVAGTRGKCLIVNLPGSPKGVKECLEVILPALPHAIELLQGQPSEHRVHTPARH